MTDPLHELAGRTAREQRQRIVAGIAFSDSGAYLDQFMVGQGAIQFRDHRIGEPGVAEHDDGVHGMREAAQVLLLFFAECHPRIIVFKRNRKYPCPSVQKAVPVGSPNMPAMSSSNRSEE